MVENLDVASTKQYVLSWSELRPSSVPIPAQKKGQIFRTTPYVYIYRERERERERKRDKERERERDRERERNLYIYKAWCRKSVLFF